MRSLESKIAVVTGGSRGIGRAIAGGFADQGATVVTTGRSVPAPGHPFDHRVCDVVDSVAVESTLRAVEQDHGQLDIVVCNAGITRDGLLMKQPFEEWAEVLTTNVLGTVTALQAAGRIMKESGRPGTIILVSSCTATRVAVGASAYCASKAAIEMITRSAAAEFARYGIRVNCLAPGYIDAGMGAQLQDNERAWSHISPRLLTNRLGQAQEVADSATFLAGERASYINGHVLEVNGGLMWA